MDFNFYGHQIVAHVVDSYNAESTCQSVDGDPVPIPHFGLSLSQSDFHALSKRLRDARFTFELEPHVRFEGQAGAALTQLNPPEYDAQHGSRLHKEPDDCWCGRFGESPMTIISVASVHHTPISRSVQYAYRRAVDDVH